MSDKMMSLMQDEDLMKNVLLKSSTNVHTELFDVCGKKYAEDLKDAFVAKKKKLRVDVKRNLNAEDLQSLVDLFPEFDVVSSNCQSGSHDIAAAMRKLELEYLKTLIPTGTWYYDIGGNFATHALNGNSQNVHCCCPILETRDAQRKMRRLVSLENFLKEGSTLEPERTTRIVEIFAEEERISSALKKSSKNGRLPAPEELQGKWFCQNRFEDCTFNPGGSKYAIAVHSIYDIRLSDLVDALEEKGVKVLVGTYLFSVDMLLGKTAGDLPSVDGRYVIEGDYIKYAFKGDPNCGYKHNKRQLMEYATKTFVKARGGSVYYLESTQMRGDVVFFSLTNSTEARVMGVREDESFKHLPINCSDKVIYPIFNICEKSGELTFEEKALPRRFVDRAIDYAVKMKDTQLNTEGLISFIASANGMSIQDGANRKFLDKIESTLLAKVVTTLQVYVEIQKEKQKLVLTKLRAAAKGEVSLVELFKTVFFRIFGKKNCYRRGVDALANWIGYHHGPIILEFTDIPAYLEVTDRVKVWGKVSTKDDGFFLDHEAIGEKMELYKQRERTKEELVRGIVLAKHNIKIEDAEKRVLEEVKKADAKLFSGELKKGVVDSVFLYKWCENDAQWFEGAEVKEKKLWKWLGAFVETVKSLKPKPLEFSPLFDEVVLDDSDESEDSDEEDEEVVVEKEKEEEEEDESNHVSAELMLEFDVVRSDPSLECEASTSTSEIEEVTLQIDEEAVVPVPEGLSFPEDQKDALSDVVVKEKEDGESEDATPSEDDVSSTSEVEIVEVEKLKSVSWASECDSSESEEEEIDEENWLKVSYAKFPTKPNFLPGEAFDSCARRELLWYYRCKAVADKSTIMDLIRYFCLDFLHAAECEFPKDASFLDFRKGKSSTGEWFLGKKPNRLGHAFAVSFFLDGHSFPECVRDCQFLKLSWEKNSEGKFVSDKPTNRNPGGILLFCDLTFIMNEFVKYRSCLRMMKNRKQRKSPRVILNDGVPGCGKTTWIIENAKLKEEIVLATGRETANDSRERFRREKKCTAEDAKRVRTIDSFLMHCEGKYRCNTIHVDEAMLSHAGEIYFCALACGARRIICQGDSNQIKFINRVEGISLQYASIKVDDTVQISLSHRIPCDIADYLTRKNFYGLNVIKTTNKNIRSVQAFGPRSNKGAFTSKFSIPKKEGVQYITFTQAEKLEMQQYLGKKWVVHTVHEVQGKTFDDVALVRLKDTDNEIYPGSFGGTPYNVVAVSRHRRSLVYYTKAEDKLYWDIEEMTGIMENKLHKSLHCEGEK